ncbi:MAG: alpha-amylase family glycosyl hydrolase, partial [Rikenellaceae bacterium]
MLAEGGDSDLFGCDFDILYGWDFAAKLKELFAGNITVAQLYDTHREETLNLSKGKVRLRYSTNHDMASEHSPLTSYGDERGAMAAFVIASMLDGVPLIYSSQEIGYSDRLTFFDYVIMDWDSNPDYYDEYVQLMSIYSATSHLRGGELYLYSTDNVASFYRKGIDGGLFVVVNPTNESQLIKTPIERSGDSVRNLLDGSLLSLPSIMTLEAYQYCIFEVL